MTTGEWIYHCSDHQHALANCHVGVFTTDSQGWEDLDLSGSLVYWSDAAPSDERIKEWTLGCNVSVCTTLTQNTPTERIHDHWACVLCTSREINYVFSFCVGAKDTHTDDQTLKRSVDQRPDAVDVAHVLPGEPFHRTGWYRHLRFTPSQPRSAYQGETKIFLPQLHIPPLMIGEIWGKWSWITFQTWDFKNVDMFWHEMRHLSSCSSSSSAFSFLYF